MCVVVLTMITGAITSALITSLGASTSARQRVRESNDEQLIAAFFTRDGQAAGGTNPLTGVVDPTLGVSTVDNAGCVARGSLLVRMKWVDRSASAASAHVVVYSFDASKQQIIRTTCVGSDPAAASVLANNVVSTASPRSPTAWCDDNESAPCPVLPNKISVRVTESNSPQPSPQPLRYTLTASTRAQAAPLASGPSGLTVPLLLFGGPGCPAGKATGLSLTASTLRVHGQAFINSAANAASCPAMRLGTLSGYSAAGTWILSSGTCRSAGFLAGPCPTTTSYPNPMPDPYAGLSPPAAPPGSPSGCPGGHASPGVYTNTLVIGAGACTLDSGVYILERGISVTTGSISSGPGGVLLYITGGTFSTALGALVNLSPMTTGPYAGLLLWQDKTDTTPLAMSDLALFALNGTVYAPTAPLHFSNVSVSLKVGGIVAKSLALNTIGAMDVGP